MTPVAKRFRGSAVVVFAAAVLLIGSAASAKTANPNLIPSNSAYVVSIPDMPAFWNAWKANAIYGAYKKVMASPDVAPAMEGFNQQLKTIEGALGFPINGETISQIFQAVEIYVRPGETAGSTMTGVILNVKDRQKLDKLIDLAEKAAATAANRDETTGTDTQETMGADATDASTTGTESPISTETYQGVTLKRFESGEDKEMFYAMVGEQMLGSNERAELKALIDRTKAAGAPAQAITAAPGYTTIESKLTDPAEVYLYINQKQALELQQMPANMDQIGELMRQMSAGFESSGLSLKFNPKDVTMHGFAPMTADTQSSMAALLKRYPATKPLEIVSFAPQEILVLFATNLVDARLYFDMIANFYAAFSGQPASELEKTLGQAEPMLGFSVQNDLLPALGNEAAFMLNSIKMGGGLPAVDASLVFRVADKTKMNKVTAGFEKIVAARMAGGDDATQTPAAGAGFKSEKVGDMTIKYMDMPNMPGYSPAYAMSGDYLLIATSRESIRKLADLKAGKGAGLLAGEAFKALGSKITAQTNVLQFMNFTGIWDAASGFLTMMPGAQGAAKYIDMMRVLKAAGASKFSKEDGVYTEGVLLLQ
jgi:hypothetical protein